MKTPDRVMVCGDFHGNLKFAATVIGKAKLEGITHIIQVGDFGFVWPGMDEHLRRLNNYLKSIDITLWFIDGNHEDFDALLALPVGEDGLREVASHIFHIPRGHTWEWNGQVWMGLGGATSLDRKNRIPGAHWWPQEALTLSDGMHAIMAADKVDVMITHDCPAGVEIPSLHHHRFDQDALDAADKNRQLLEGVVKELKPSLLLHGHFHQRYDSIFKYEDGSACHIIGLQDDGHGSVTKNFVIVDL